MNEFKKKKYATKEFLYGKNVNKVVKGGESFVFPIREMSPALTAYVLKKYKNDKEMLKKYGL